MHEEMYDQMYEMESYHWWFKAKREIILALAQPILTTKEEPLKIADFGCGTGIMLQTMERYGDTTGFDFSETALKYCRCKVSEKTTLKQVDLGRKIEDGLDNYYDIAFALDIIEHIDDDYEALINILRKLKRGGYVIVTVPAFQCLWSQHDENNMHKRRYNKEQLAEILRKTGFEIEFISYYNFWLFLPIAVVRFVSRVLHLDKHSKIEGDSGKKGILNSILYKIFISEKAHLTKHKGFPCGVSLIAVCSKPN